jgi:hypothetical protein
MNPTLSDLLGGIQSVTLSDEEARRRGTQKSVLERKAPPTFDIVIEIMEVDKLAIHHDVSKVVDRSLRGTPPRPEIRVRNPEGEVEVVQEADREVRRTGEMEQEMAEEMPVPAKALPQTVRIFPYGVSRSRLDRAIREMRVPAYISKDWKEADVILTLKAQSRKEPAKLREASGRDLPTYVIKSNTYTQIANAVKSLFRVTGFDAEGSALEEAGEAIEQVLAGEPSVELLPQNSYIRRLQHQLVEEHHLVSESVGAEPYRRLRITHP